jgi:hypothetical protein
MTALAGISDAAGDLDNEEFQSVGRSFNFSSKRKMLAESG